MKKALIPHILIRLLAAFLLASALSLQAEEDASTDSAERKNFESVKKSANCSYLEKRIAELKKQSRRQSGSSSSQTTSNTPTVSRSKRVSTKKQLRKYRKEYKEQCSD